MEVFLEATPSAFVFMILIASSSAVGSNPDDETDRNAKGGLLLLLRGPMDGTYWGAVQFALFILSCGSSIFS